MRVISKFIINIYIIYFSCCCSYTLWSKFGIFSVYSLPKSISLSFFLPPTTVYHFSLFFFFLLLSQNFPPFQRLPKAKSGNWFAALILLSVWKHQHGDQCACWCLELSTAPVPHKNKAGSCVASSHLVLSRSEAPHTPYARDALTPTPAQNLQTYRGCPFPTHIRRAARQEGPER